MSREVTPTTIHIDSVTGEPMVHVDTRGLWLEALIAVLSLVALLTIAAWASSWWIPYVFDQVSELNSATWLALQAPEFALAASTYAISRHRAVRKHLHPGVLEGVSIYALLATLVLVCALI